MLGDTPHWQKASEVFIAAECSAGLAVHFDHAQGSAQLLVNETRGAHPVRAVMAELIPNLESCFKRWSACLRSPARTRRAKFASRHLAIASGIEGDS